MNELFDDYMTGNTTLEQLLEGYGSIDKIAMKADLSNFLNNKPMLQIQA